MNVTEFADELRKLDYNDPGAWPNPIKVTAIILVCAAVLFLGYWFLISGQQNTLRAAAEKEKDLRTTFESKAFKATNLEVYRAQMEDIKRTLGTMLRQLPSKTEVDSLLEDISQTGIANGLEFELFKPEQEIPVEFYAELPIKIKVAGDYHQFGSFVSGVATLSRIVTIQDIHITLAPSSGVNKNSKDKPVDAGLFMEATAKTYRYLEEGETLQ